MAAVRRARPFPGPTPAVAAGLLGLLSLASALGGDRGGGGGSTRFPWEAVRLPRHVIPLHYHLLIHPNLTTLTLAGTAAIEVAVSRQTSAVVLHSKHLRITRAAVEAGSARSAREARVLEHQPLEQVALLTAEPLRAGHGYTLLVQYLANLSESFHGFYKSTYRTQEGELRVLAATQFEPTAARMAFPCFDEPAFKARFSIKIRREPKHLALSNMPIVGGYFNDVLLIDDLGNKKAKGEQNIQAIDVNGNGDLTITAVLL